MIKVAIPQDAESSISISLSRLGTGVTRVKLTATSPAGRALLESARYSYSVFSATVTQPETTVLKLSSEGQRETAYDRWASRGDAWLCEAIEECLSAAAGRRVARELAGPPTTLTDQNIRYELRRLLLAEDPQLRRHQLDTGALAANERILLDELPLLTARADLAIASKDHLACFEIKSDRDSLHRLSRQSESYAAVADEVSLCAVDRHLDRALAVVPAWWGILRAEGSNESNVSVTWLRRPSTNPKLDPTSLASLLWSDELRRWCRQDAPRPGLAKMRKADLAEHIAGTIEHDQLRRHVRAWTANGWNYTHGRPVLPGGSRLKADQIASA